LSATNAEMEMMPRQYSWIPIKMVNELPIPETIADEMFIETMPSIQQMLPPISGKSKGDIFFTGSRGNPSRKLTIENMLRITHITTISMRIKEAVPWVKVPIPVIVTGPMNEIRRMH
jgi:hypothetical protein